MALSVPIRACLAALLSCAAAAPSLAQAIPPAQPTFAPAPPQEAPKKPQTASEQPAHRAQIDYRAGQLSVAADNSSLNQILRDIGRLTGMKITGGVTEERVFGSYGPSDTSTVLSALLGGTGSNLLLVFDDHEAPQELVLTPRNGGATPPNPNASRGNPGDEDDLPPQLTRHTPRDVSVPPPQPKQPPAAPEQTQPQPPSQSQPDQPSPAPAPDTTTQQSPNGVPTPSSVQSIYDKLMQMQQQKKQTPPQ